RGALDHLAGALAELFGLFGQRLHLLLDVLGLQLEDLVDIPGADQLLSEFEGLQNVVLSESHCGLPDIAGALACGFRLTFEGAHRAVRGRYEALKGLSRLLETLLGEGSHFGRYFEILARIPGHGLPPPAFSLSGFRLVPSFPDCRSSAAGRAEALI